MSGGIHTNIYFPCHQSYWPGFSEGEAGFVELMIRLHARPFLMGWQIHCVVEPGKFCGVVFDREKMTFSDDRLTEGDKEWLRDDNEADALRFYNMWQRNIRDLVAKHRSRQGNSGATI